TQSSDAAATLLLSLQSVISRPPEDDCEGQAPLPGPISVRSPRRAFSPETGRGSTETGRSRPLPFRLAPGRRRLRWLGSRPVSLATWSCRSPPTSSLAEPAPAQSDNSPCQA